MDRASSATAVQGGMDAVTAALRALRAPGAFAAEVTCLAESMHIEVAGVGLLRFPITAATAKKLCAVARAAPFGRRDRTLHDKSVRDTWEIDKKAIKLDGRRWGRALGPQLAAIQGLLGIPPGGKLRAVLDKMLVYGPGQFFAPHQDSERSDDMLGSLVVELPSAHVGGAFVVEHNGEKKVFRGANGGPDALSLLAFYADCRHEVEPVESGYRVVLTYHLLHAGAASGKPALAPERAVERVIAAVEGYFSTAVAARYSASPAARPDRLVYLLDHEYTQKSLGWDRLKNGDRERVQALRRAAEKLDCEQYLALADVHESWSCEEEEWDPRYRWGRRGYPRYDDAEERKPEDYELYDLLDSTVELLHWVGLDGPAPRMSATPLEREVCSTRPSVEMDPFKSEHEGYQGNYGNTADRWYHRAAFVLWPKERNFVIRAKASPAWALTELVSHLRASRREEAREMARSLLPFWGNVPHHEEGPSFFRTLFTTVCALDDADLATGLLAAAGPDRLDANVAPVFVTLLEQFGLAWAQNVFDSWSRPRRRGVPWLRHLPRLCETLVAHGEKHGRALATWLTDRELDAFCKSPHVAFASASVSGGDVSEEDQDEILALFASARATGAAKVRDRLIAFLTSPRTGLPLMAAGGLLRRCRKLHDVEGVRALGLGELARHVESALSPLLAAPPRRPNDWSIEPPGKCGCDLCKQLAVFLRDPDRVEHRWPLAKEKRRHIHNVLDAFKLPVTHVTLRKGSPQTLVLEKQEVLFERDTALRARQRALSKWLKKERSTFEAVPAAD